MKNGERGSFKSLPLPRKILWVALAVIAVWLVLSTTDVYQRHFGMGFSDRMNIRVVLDGQALPPDDYTVSYSLDHDYSKRIAARQTNDGYSINSGYGFYEIHVELPVKDLGFAVDNINSWWRSDIALDITTLADGRLRVVKTLEIINVESAAPITTEWIE